MKALTIVTYLGVAGVGILGMAMATTNPDQAKYEKFAVEQLTGYLKTDVCKKAPNFLEKFVQVDCDRLIDSANPQIRDIITSTTTRQNYILFSVYRTELKIDSLLPGYTFETVGAFDNFYTYSAEKN
ncbi:MAG TPA: DUF4359 domain-containing protein [Nostocaceae cyanobacterium]|nr:DUF4359 domain-containing protein [Nostocaceae cyanobacterium]